MSEIKKGDLVMVIKPCPCCGDGEEIGQIYTSDGALCTEVICDACGNESVRTLILDDAEPGAGCSVERVIRLDPSNLSEGVPTHQEITA